jgi:two-component system sensor histidine kinase/response regulator
LAVSDNISSIMINRRLWRLVLLLCLLAGGNALTFAADPAKKHPRIIALVDSLNEQASPLIRLDPGKAFTLLTEAEILATQYNYSKGRAVAYLNQAEVLNQRGYSTRALELYYRSMQLSRQNKDVYNVARAEQYISTIKRKGGSFKEAEDLLTHTLETFSALNKPVDMVNIQLKLGLLYAEQKNYDKAMAYYNMAYNLSAKIKYPYGQKKSFYNRAILYEEMHKPEDAINYLNKGLAIDSISGDTYGKALTYIELSKVYINRKKYKEALPYAALAYNKADSCAAMGLVKTAVQLLLNISKASVDKDAIIQWQDELIYVDNLINDRERKQANDFIDALRSQEEQQLKVQHSVLMAEKKAAQQKNLIIVYIGALLCSAVVVVILLYSYKKAKQKNAKLNAQKQQIERQIVMLDKLNREVLSQNQKLEDDNVLKSKLLSIISHDLRKPLANTQSILHLVNAGLVSERETKDLFTRLEAQYGRVMTLTDNLLFWIRGQVSGAPIKKETVNLYDTVNNIIEETVMPISEKRLEVQNHLPAELAWVTENETLKIILRNLINNAVKFTPVNGVIAFTATVNDHETRLTITDSGIGISPAMMEHINSENYYTTKGTQNEEGSGFGLMLIRDLLKKQNGRLKINSKPGEGSAFTISFPAVTAVLPLVAL